MREAEAEQICQAEAASVVAVPASSSLTQNLPAASAAAVAALQAVPGLNAAVPAVHAVGGMPAGHCLTVTAPCLHVAAAAGYAA